MSHAIALLVALSCAAEGADAGHGRYIRVHKEWLRLHEAPDAHAQLVIDPREHAMWLEDHGQVLGTFTAGLPRGFRWYAFHVTQNGIVERSFPVRLTTPRRNLQDESKEEQLWVIGATENKSVWISLSASRSGAGFHVGSGSTIGDVTFRLPAILRDGKELTLNSFVGPQSPRSARPTEMIRKAEFSVRVTRRPTPPNAE